MSLTNYTKTQYSGDSSYCCTPVEEPLDSYRHLYYSNIIVHRQETKTETGEIMEGGTMMRVSMAYV